MANSFLYEISELENESDIGSDEFSPTLYDDTPVEP